METPVRAEVPVRKPESVSHALKEVAEAGQHVIADRIDLTVLRWRESMVRFSLVLLGALILLGGWIALAFSIGDLIAAHTSTTVALASVGGFHLLAGGLLLLLARSKPEAGHAHG